MQLQLVWLTRTLLVLRPCPWHTRHAASPASEKVPAPQTLPQTALLVGVQAAAVTLPAHVVQAAQGASPVEFHVLPLTHRRAHVELAAFQAKPAVELQPHVLWPASPLGA